MKEALRSLNQLKTRGLIEDFAIGGGIATIYYTEPFFTYDLDVFIILKGKKPGLTLLSPIFDYLRTKGYQWKGEHIIIGGIPTQFIPADELEQEAVRKANTITYQGISTRILAPEYLVAILLRAGRPKDKRKVQMLWEQFQINKKLLYDILTRYGLTDKLKELI